VTTTFTRYQPVINNRPGRNSLGSGPSHAISIKSHRCSWPMEFLKVLMLFVEENNLSHSAMDGQRIKVETQLLSYQKWHIIPSAKYEYS